MSAADVASWNRECVICGNKWDDRFVGECHACIERVEGMWERNGVGRKATDCNPLIPAAIAVARSEAAASTPPPGEPEGQAHEPWPEMDALVAALDVVRPGWRVAT